MNNLMQTRRVIPFSPEKIYAAFADGETLAKWWGPTGFTNEFETFEFKTGGRWKFDMIDPDGRRYANQSFFAELIPAKKVVIRHDCAPYFTLTVKLEPHKDGTMLHWDGVFDDPQVLEAILHIVTPVTRRAVWRDLTEVWCLGCNRARK